MCSIHFIDIISSNLVQFIFTVFDLMFHYVAYFCFFMTYSILPCRLLCYLHFLFEPPPFFLTCRCTLAIPYFPHFFRTSQLLVNEKSARLVLDSGFSIPSGFFSLLLYFRIIPPSISLLFPFPFYLFQSRLVYHFSHSLPPFILPLD